MKVLMIAPQPFFEPRGTPISVYQRLHGLSSLGHEIDLVTYSIGDNVDMPGVTIYRTPPIPFVKSVRIGPSLAKIPLDIMIFFTALRMLLTQRYHVIHSHEEAAFCAVLLSKIFRTPHLYDMHSSLPKQFANFNFGNNPIVVGLFRILENIVLKTCDVVLTIGSDLEEYVLHVNQEANHVRIENTAVHSNTQLESREITTLEQGLNLVNKTAIVYTGTFEGYQGIDMLFQAAESVVAHNPEVCFVMVGGKPDQVSYWRRQVESQGLAEHVIFVGTVPLDESLKYLELADILVSSRTVGLSVPLKIYSYLRSGKPIVATNIYAHTQVLDEDTAILVEPNAEAFAAGLLQLVRSPELRRKIGANARTYAEREFSKEAYLNKLERAYLAVKLHKRISEVVVPETSTGTTVSVK